MRRDFSWISHNVRKQEGGNDFFLFIEKQKNDKTKKENLGQVSK